MKRRGRHASCSVQSLCLYHDTMSELRWPRGSRTQRLGIRGYKPIVTILSESFLISSASTSVSVRSE
jgi:hypothetical protein